MLCASKVVCCPLNSARQKEEAAGRCFSMKTIMDAILILNLGYLLCTGLFCPDSPLENMGMCFKPCPKGLLFSVIPVWIH